MGGDRTSFPDVHGASTTSTTYCYNNADQLTSTAATGAVSGASPVSGTNLVPTYDAHGNTVSIADETLTFDGADQHTNTVLSDGTHLDYIRDALGRVMERIRTPPSGSSILPEDELYLYGPSGLYEVNDATTGLSRTVGLPGGVTVTILGGAMKTATDAGTVWSYPNLHGDMGARLCVAIHRSFPRSSPHRGDGVGEGDQVEVEVEEIEYYG